MKTMGVKLMLLISSQLILMVGISCGARDITKQHSSQTLDNDIVERLNKENAIEGEDDLPLFLLHAYKKDETENKQQVKDRGDDSVSLPLLYWYSHKNGNKENKQQEKEPISFPLMYWYSHKNGDKENKQQENESEDESVLFPQLYWYSHRNGDKEKKQQENEREDEPVSLPRLYWYSHKNGDKENKQQEKESDSFPLLYWYSHKNGNKKNKQQENERGDQPVSSPLLYWYSRKNDEGKRQQEMVKEQNNKDDVHGTHMSHMHLSRRGFFTINDFYVGKELSIDFRDKQLPNFLPKEEADIIPFSLEKLEEIFRLFSISKGSSEANAVEDSLGLCEANPTEGETKFCATSLESMLSFVRSFLGKNSTRPIKALTTTYESTGSSTTTPQANMLQNYTITGISKVEAGNEKVACHVMPYPVALFVCHGQNKDGDAKAFEVTLRGANGEKLKTPAVCHTKTSRWDPDYVGFQLLGVKRGTPICHFFLPNDILWVPAALKDTDK